MKGTRMKAGRLVAIYVDDAQGRRIVVAQPNDRGDALEGVATLATNKAEAREAITALRQLVEELPEAP
jgi:hypothetical protein